jgi:hypothetical protein
LLKKIFFKQENISSNPRGQQSKKNHEKNQNSKEVCYNDAYGFFLSYVVGGEKKEPQSL